ncbi:unnamed protein product [Nesidiocoris tenuis]|uniref:Uncharacterized protein n=1 Tax=Nesidiocoris tenuis TaxID=355587 RepID=A0A6H5HKQ1_9HEMI|nr:unnamed protein product [Nesidiocoris tenuis]
MAIRCLEALLQDSYNRSAIQCQEISTRDWRSASETPFEPLRTADNVLLFSVNCLPSSIVVI